MRTLLLTTAIALVVAQFASSVPDVGILVNSSRLLRPGRLHPPA